MDYTVRYVAEAVGTFVLVLFGCGAAVFGGAQLGNLGIAFAFGLSIVTMAYTVGPRSGCHLNPAVSLAMLINERLTVGEFFGYIGAQIIGALAGSGVLALLLRFAGKDTTQMGQNLTQIGVPGAFIAEVVLTFVFVLIIMNTTGKLGSSPLAGLTIGLGLTMVHILGIPLTGTSVNPARSLAPAIFAGGEALSQLWIFIVAPLIGGALGALAGRGFGSEGR